MQSEKKNRIVPIKFSEAFLNLKETKYTITNVRSQNVIDVLDLHITYV